MRSRYGRPYVNVRLSGQRQSTVISHSSDRRANETNKYEKKKVTKKSGTLSLIHSQSYFAV
jgi:hypothetical protein